MKVLFTGGGTGGSVTPLLAIHEYLKQSDDKHQFFWLGTKKGPEGKLVIPKNIKFRWIFWGKWRRYLSLRNLVDPFFIALGFLQSLYHIAKWGPDIIVTAGSFVAVPVVWAAWFLRKKIIVHQQDLRKGLANALMAPLADKITVTFEESLRDFSAKKVVWTGNPVRPEVLQGDRKEGQKIFGLEDSVPTVLIIGGGTGAVAINKMFNQKAVSDLTEKCQIIHVTGAGKKILESQKRYHAYTFLTDELKHAYIAADLVVSRVGLGALTELSALGKATIFIPLPGTHQEDNARYVADKGACIVLDQNKLSSDRLVEKIKELLSDNKKREELGEKIRGVMKSAPRRGSGPAGESVVREIGSLIKAD